MGNDDNAARFRALVLPELAYLRRLGLALAANRAAADDLVQESVLRALRYFHSYKGENFRAWMAAIMRNAHRDRPRDGYAAIEEEAVNSIADSAPDPEQQAMSKSNSSKLRGLVAALPESLREVLILREYGNLSYTQIAAVLQVPAGTVMSRLSRAREALRSAWFADDTKVTP